MWGDGERGERGEGGGGEVAVDGLVTDTMMAQNSSDVEEQPGCFLSHAVWRLNALKQP